jgi:hypothetical protein
MPTMSNNPFSDIDSSKVYARVLDGLDATQRSLWKRLESELRSSGVLGAESYLKSEFQSAAEKTQERLKSFREASVGSDLGD